MNETYVKSDIANDTYARTNTMTNAKWCIADGTAGIIDCNVEPVVDTDTIFDITNVAFYNDSLRFTNFVNYTKDLLIENSTATSLQYINFTSGVDGTGTQTYNGSCMIIKGEQSTLEIC